MSSPGDGEASAADSENLPAGEAAYRSGSGRWCGGTLGRGGPAGVRAAGEGRPDPVAVWPHGAHRAGEGQPAAGAQGPEDQSGRDERAAGHADGDHPGQGRGHHEAVSGLRAEWQPPRGRLAHPRQRSDGGAGHSQGSL